MDVPLDYFLLNYVERLSDYVSYTVDMKDVQKMADSSKIYCQTQIPTFGPTKFSDIPTALHS